MQKTKSYFLSIIPTTLLTAISGGGNNEPSPQVTINGGGGPGGAGGTLALSVPVGPTVVTTTVSANTNNGLTAVGIDIRVPWG